MNSSRIPRIISAMKEGNLTQMIVSDPAAPLTFNLLLLSLNPYIHPERAIFLPPVSEFLFESSCARRNCPFRLRSDAEDVFSAD